MWLKYKITAFVLLGVLLGAITLIPGTAKVLTNASTDILFKLRGPRPVSDQLFLVYIDSQDLQELGGWPITRDYFGYLTYILKKAGAEIVAIDVLFSTEDQRYPEYDQDFAQFVRTSGNVILPFAFSQLTDSYTRGELSYYLGSQPHFPVNMFRKHLLGTGFSNLPNETIIRSSVLAAYDDSLYPSLGLECARLFKFGSDSYLHFQPDRIIIGNDSSEQNIATDGYYTLRLDHFQAVQNIPSMSLVDVLQTYQTQPESLDFTDKLVFVAVTAPGTAPTKVTPTQSAFPASLVHFTVAENIIENNYIRSMPVMIKLLILLLFLTSAFGLTLKWTKALFYLVVFFVLYIVVATILFKTAHIALPLITPALALLFSAVVSFVLDYFEKIQSQDQWRTLYENEISNKEQQWQEAQSHLEKAQNKLEQNIQTHHAEAEKSRRQVEEKQQEILRLEKELRDLRATPPPSKTVSPTPFSNIIHTSQSKMVQVLELVAKVSSDDIPVLITGETGTGKEVIARAIHDSGTHAGKPFIAVNCGALPETLLESELFGHEKGAFTGATSARKGRFELADGGTLFLDEITETVAAFQAKLLRVLQEGTFERLGSEKTIHVNVRIIAASSKNIKTQVDAGRFREDLYYRLYGFPIELPPLCERREDIPLLADHFLAKHGYKDITTLSQRALDVMTQYHWPGNVRELENTIRRAAILAQSEQRDMIRESDLPGTLREKALDSLALHYQTFDEQILHVLRSLKFSHSSISQTAQALGNKDRGTITEYFRGLCFEHLVENDFHVDSTARSLAASDDEKIIEKVKNKINEYVTKVQKNRDLEKLTKGLPSKFHPALRDILDYIDTAGDIV